MKAPKPTWIAFVMFAVLVAGPGWVSAQCKPYPAASAGDVFAVSFDDSQVGVFVPSRGENPSTAMVNIQCAPWGIRNFDVVRGRDPMDSRLVLLLSSPEDDEQLLLALRCFPTVELDLAVAIPSERQQPPLLRMQRIQNGKEVCVVETDLDYVFIDPTTSALAFWKKPEVRDRFATFFSSEGRDLLFMRSLQTARELDALPVEQHRAELSLLRIDFESKSVDVHSTRTLSGFPVLFVPQCYLPESDLLLGQSEGAFVAYSLRDKSRTDLESAPPYCAWLYGRYFLRHGSEVSDKVDVIEFDEENRTIRPVVTCDSAICEVLSRDRESILLLTTDNQSIRWNYLKNTSKAISIPTAKDFLKGRQCDIPTLLPGARIVVNLEKRYGKAGTVD